MPTQTTNFNLNKPLVNDPTDEDLWGGQLNVNMDTIDDRLCPTGTIQFYAGTTSPSASWLLCDGAEASRTTFSVLFALVGTSFGVGDGSTTFNLPDMRGRVPIGLDNLGGSSADRITDINADSLNNTGAGNEIPAGTVGTVGDTGLTDAQMPAHRHQLFARKFDSSSALAGNNFAATGHVSGGAANVTPTAIFDISILAMGFAGSSQSHNHTGGAFSGSPGENTQPWLAFGAIIKT